MSSPHQVRKTEEKLGLIFGRVRSIRNRLNSLAWQRAAFGALGWIIAVGAIVVLAAFYLEPLLFLIAATMLGLVALAGVTESVRAGWRLHVNQGAAASIADRRADLKGRLETIIELGQHQKVVKLRHSPEHLLLWSYLIEDTLSRQEEFAPARIEARRVSRSLYGFLGALVLALAIVPLVAHLRGRPVPLAANQDEMTVDLNDLHLRAADSDSDDGVEVHADAGTMRKLEDKLAAEAAAGSGKSSDTPMDKMMNHAKDLAGRLQEKLTGRAAQRARLTLKLADNSQDLDSLEKRPPVKLNPIVRVRMRTRISNTRRAATTRRRCRTMRFRTTRKKILWPAAVARRSAPPSSARIRRTILPTNPPTRLAAIPAATADRRMG